MLSLSHVTKKYKNKSLPNNTTFLGIDDINIDIPEGKIVSIVGESGSGKSTLAKVIINIEKYKGDIYFNKKNIRNIPKKEYKKNVQMIFQNSKGILNPSHKIKFTLQEALRVHTNLTEKERLEKIIFYLEKIGLNSDYLDRYPYELSGGQAQRIAVLASLIINPKILICDEITSALDVTVQLQLLQLLLKLKDEFNLTIIFITHDLSVAHYLSDYIIVMHQGKIVEEGEKNDVFLRAQHMYTKKLLEARYVFKNHERK